VKLFSKQSAYRQALDATSGGVLVLSNLDNANIKIVVGKTDKIIFDLQGDDDLLAKTSLGRTNALLAEFGLFGDGSGISGTITVPEGMVIDMRMKQGKDLYITDPAGQKAITGAGSYVIDTNSVSSVNVTSGGSVSVVGWGDVTVLNDKDWNFFDLPGAGDKPSDENVSCSIGSQSVRNYCCDRTKYGVTTPLCNGFGHWIFNNTQRQCQFSCESEAEKDCGIGSQLQRDACCSTQHSGQYQGCVGKWEYSSANRMCQFACVSTGSTGQPGGGNIGNGSGSGSGGGNNTGGSGSGTPPEPKYDDPVSQFCSEVTLNSEKDTCCNDALKNPLSSGPHPGYPDCIGKYYFDSDDGCLFRCAEYTEMIEILNEIKQNIQQPQ
jgi:hypothetical protein